MKTNFQAAVAHKPEKSFENQPNHRIRITLTSQNVKALEKGKYLLFIQISNFLYFSLREADRSCQDREVRSQGPRPSPHQGSPHHYPQDPLW